MTERIRSSSRMSSVRSAPGSRARALWGVLTVTANSAGNGRVILVLFGPHCHDECNPACPAARKPPPDLRTSQRPSFVVRSKSLVIDQSCGQSGVEKETLPPSRGRVYADVRDE